MRSRCCKTTTRAGLLLALMALSACSTGPAETTADVELAKVIGARISQWRKPKPEPLVVTRALLEQLDQPHIEVRVEREDLTGYMGLHLTRRDDLPGEITIWRSSDNATLAFRNGMLMTSHGLGDDLLSAEVPAVADQPGPARGGGRSYSLRGGDNQAFQLNMVCSVTDLGPETIEIVELRYTTRHLQEHCEGGEGIGAKGVVVNDYWIDSRTAKLWQSRQWAGPGIGYLRIRDLAS
jgi:Group 4 capsule polysaccharide lipoprotein gfcB, YjbF